jgi:hypothetical protein
VVWYCRQAWVVAQTALAALSLANIAFADAISLPVIGASDRRAQIDTTLGFVVSNESASGKGSAPAFVQAQQFETNVADDAYRIGIRYATGSAILPARESSSTELRRNQAMVTGNVTVWFRAQNVTVHGLSFSSGVNLTLPTSWQRIGGPADDASRSLRSLRLDQRVDYTVKSLSVSPHVDVRVTASAFTFQLRQTLDASMEVSSRALQTTTATSILFAGVRVGDFHPGLEFVNLYTLDAAASDDSRHRWTLFPHLRYQGQHVEPYVGLIVGAPSYHPRGSATVAARLGFNLLF